MDSPKFRFFRLLPRSVYYVGGFGVRSAWVEGSEFLSADADILAKDAGRIVARLNAEHQEDLMDVARHLLRVGTAVSARVQAVDRLGFDVRVGYLVGRKAKTDEYRIGFRTAIVSVEDAKSELLKVFQEAWEVGNGMMEVGEGGEAPVYKRAEDALGNK
jgi:hypothetical protein